MPVKVPLQAPLQEPWEASPLFVVWGPWVAASKRSSNPEGLKDSA